MSLFLLISVFALLFLSLHTHTHNLYFEILYVMYSIQLNQMSLSVLQLSGSRQDLSTTCLLEDKVT